ncbi:hypothetical protein CR513_39918, partial [Mucuna pruriens]
MLLLKVKLTLIHPIDHMISSVLGVKELNILLLNIQIKEQCMMDNGEVESKSSSDDEMPPLEDCSDMEVVEPIMELHLILGMLLAYNLRKMLMWSHVSIFLILGSLFKENNIGEVKVDKQVSVPFAIENYKDEVLCDVVLMEAGHILLGRPWQLDRKVTHKGYTNCLSFIYNELKITLTPLTPKQVCEDQIKMRKVRECKLREEKLSIQEKERKENMTENK